MGHSLLNLGSYAHIHLQPVLSNITTYLTFIFLVILTSTFELIIYLWLSWLMMGVFGSSIYVITIPSPIMSCKKRRHLPHPNWTWPNIWRLRKLHYCIVCHCRCLPNNRPPRLDVSFFPWPYCAKHRLWRRGGSHAEDFLKRRRMDEFLSGRKYGYLPWEYEGVSNTARDSFWDDNNRNFLQLKILLPSFTKLDHVENVTDLTQISIFFRGQII